MRKIAIFSGLGVAIALGAALYGMTAGLPKLANEKTLLTLRKWGFYEIVLPPAQARFGAIRYENASLDPEGISSIKQLDINYNPLMLFFTGHFSSVHMTGLNLTGEVTANGDVSISGWDPAQANFNLKSRHLKKLVIDGSQISLLTDQLGGLTFDYDVQALGRSNATEFQGHIASRQKNVVFTANATGQISPRGVWETDLEIEQGRFDMEPVKATRLNGKINITGEPGQSPKILGELQAGGLSLYEFPWQNASGTIQAQGDTYEILTDANSVGMQGIELTLTIENKAGIRNISGGLHTENLSTLLTYLKNLHTLPLDDAAITSFATTQGVGVDFTVENSVNEAEKNITYNIKNDNQTIDINGNIIVKDMGDYTATLAGAPQFITDPETTQITQVGFTAGQIAFSGNLAKTGETLKGAMKAEISDATYKYGPLALEKINGAFVIDNIPTLNSSQTQKFTCALPLRDGILQKCSFEAGIEKGQIAVKSLTAGLFSGLMKIKDFHPGAENAKLNLEFTGIDLWEFTRALNLKGFTTTGTAHATLPLTRENGKIFIRNGAIKNDDEGVVIYTYEQNPSFFKGDELEQETMRQALANYHYTSFDMNLDGPLEMPQISITGNGYNPELLEKRPVALNFRTQAAPDTLLQNILKP